MPTLTITHLNPGTPDHVQAVLENKHKGKRVEIITITSEHVTYEIHDPSPQDAAVLSTTVR